MSADRERFGAWLERQMANVPTPALACHGGPIDGMFAAVAESCFDAAGASLLVPSLLMLQTPVEGQIVLEHRYARSAAGAYHYVGLQRRG